MGKLIIFFLGIVLFFFGCETKTAYEGEVIEVNPHNVKEFAYLSEIADSIKLIKLQTEGSDIIGVAGQVFIRKEYIYVHDYAQQILFVFDKEGKFVSKLNKRGSGPDEYISMGPIIVGDKEDYIELFDFAARKIFKYSNISFEFIDTLSIPRLLFNHVRKSENLYYLATQQIDNRVNDIKTNAALLLFDGKKVINTLFENTIETGGSGFPTNHESFIKNEKNELFVSIRYDNTFYRLQAGEAYPLFSVSFGKYGLTNSIGQQALEKQVEYVRTMRDLAAFPVLNIYNDDIIAFSYYFKQDNEKRRLSFNEKDYRQYLKLKKNNQEYHVKYFKNDISGFPDKIYISSYFFDCAHEAWFDNYFIDIFIPDKRYFKNPTDKVFVDGLGEISAIDNPIIIMMKMKN
jgi:hypothetical protein